MINFPKVNIATSVVNRILNVHDELNRGTPSPALPELQGMPDVPEAAPEGAQLSGALAQPTPAVGAGGPQLQQDALEHLLGGQRW